MTRTERIANFIRETRETQRTLASFEALIDPREMVAISGEAQELYHQTITLRSEIVAEYLRVTDASGLNELQINYCRTVCQISSSQNALKLLIKAKDLKREYEKLENTLNSLEITVYDLERRARVLSTAFQSARKRAHREFESCLRIGG